MMDRNREARRAAAMTNGLQSQRRRHRTASGSLRESPEGDGQMELQETARLSDRTAKKDRNRETRDRDRLNWNKRQRGVDKYMHGSSRDDVVSGAGDDSSEESINDVDEDDDDGPFRYVPPSNPVSMSSSSTASTLTHRRSYPPPSKDFRSTGMVPSWKAPEETIAFSVPRKARSSSSKRPHDCWTSGGGGGCAGVVSADQIHRQASSSPVRLNNTAAGAPAPSPPPAPVSPSSSTISIRKKIKPSGQKHKPPKACPKSSPSIQDEIEIEVAEVLYGLMRQSQAPSSSSKMEVVSNDSAKLDKSTGDSKSGVHPQNSSSSAPPSLTTVAPKRKRPRPYQDENTAARTSPILPKVELDQAPKAVTPSPSTENNIVRSAVENGDLAIPQDPAAAANGVVAEAKALVEELGSRDVGVAVMSAKVEEASLSPKKESQDHNRVESTSTSIKGNSALAEKENLREEKFEIDLMAPPPPSRGSPEREGVVGYGGGMMGYETSMVTDRETEAKATEEDDKKGVNNSSIIIRGAEFNVNAGEAEAKAVAAEGEAHKHQPPPPHQHQHDNSKERNIDHQLDLEEPDGSTVVNDHKLNIPLHKQPPPPPQRPPPKAVKDEANVDNKPGQSSSVQLPMSVAAGWHGGLRPMGFVAPLQGVVSMDGTTMTSAPIQPLQFVFSPPRSKRCATHWCIGKSISNHQQMMKVTPFWPGGAAAAGSAPLLGAKAYNLNMVPSPADLHAAGRAGVNSAQDKTQPYAFFPASKDKSPLTPNAPDSSQKKQFLLPQSIPPGPPNNIVHAPAFFFPFGQQQAAATASARPSTAKSPSTAGNVASTTTSSSAPMGTCSTAGPTMSFSYPNMGGSETQFMAFLGNGPYPFPIPAHVGVGAATPYRGSHPQAMSFFNGSYYSPQMLHPSQLQQQQQQPQPAVHSQIQQQNHQNPSLSTAASSSQKHLQTQQQRPQGSGASTAGPSNPNLQNFQAAKGRPTQPPHHDMGGGEDSPSTADSRTRPNLGVYNQSFPMPFHSPNFALMTQSSSIGGGSSNTAGVQNGDKKQQQQQSQQPAYPMSFASMNGVTPPGLDISSMTHNHAFLQSLPEPARHNYQMLAAAAQAAQAVNQKKNNYQDGKTADPSNAEEERKAMASRASGASVGGQSIAFSRDLAENSISTVVDTSSCSLDLVPGSGRPTHSLGSNAATNSGAYNSQQQQMLFPKQQQYVAATVAAARSKTPVTSNGNVYPDHLTSASVMAAKFPNALPSFPPLVQSSGAPSQSPHWKNSVRPNTSQVSSPPIVATSTTSTIKNLPQQQGRPQQNHAQISFGAPATTNPKPSTTSQGQQPPNNNRAPSPPMMVRSPSNSSVSKSGGGGNPRTGTSTSVGNKSGGAQASSLSSQQGKNSPSPSPSPSISSQKPSILGSPHMMMSTSTTGSKPQMQESQHQPPLSKQSIQQTQLFFSNPYMQGSANTLAGGGYYLQRHRAENQHHHHQHVLKSQGSAPPATSSGMLSLRNPVSVGNACTTSDPAKAAAAAHSMKGGGPPQGMFHAAQYAAAQSAGATHQLVPAGYSYVHTVPTVQVKPAEQKQPAGE